MPPDLHERLRDGLRRGGWDPGLPTGRLALLASLADVLVERAVPVGLVAEGDRERVIERHVLDCLRAVVAFRTEDGHAVDIGSGAGLPGLVLATALPERRFTLIESRNRAAGFLELAVERLGLANVDVRWGRVEDVDIRADITTARAFGDLQRAWSAACGVLRPGGRLVYFAGGEWDASAVEGIDDPEPPASVVVDRVVETSSPLVMMDRRR